MRPSWIDFSPDKTFFYLSVVSEIRKNLQTYKVTTNKISQFEVSIGCFIRTWLKAGKILASSYLIVTT